MNEDKIQKLARKIARDFLAASSGTFKVLRKTSNGYLLEGSPKPLSWDSLAETLQAEMNSPTKMSSADRVKIERVLTEGKSARIIYLSGDWRVISDRIPPNDLVGHRVRRLID